jgi:hypothetical protein
MDYELTLALVSAVFFCYVLPLEDLPWFALMTATIFLSTPLLELFGMVFT